MQDLNWNDLRHLLAIDRNASLSAAARSLGVNETTVGRRLNEAETRLGARLFERRQGALSPTEAGRKAIEAAERVEREVEGLAEAVAGTDRVAAGQVRLTSVPLLVNRVLVPALPSLMKTHPGLRLELIAEPRDLSLTKREADLALRLARPRRELRALARRLGQLDYGVFGPAGTTAADLPWITYEDAMADLPQWRWVRSQPDSAAGPPPLTVNDAEAIIQAIRAGIGKSLVPMAVAGADPLLRRLDQGEPALSREIWLLVHPELRGLTRVQTVISWLERTIRAINL